MSFPINAYKIKNINKVDTEKIQYDFPVFYPYTSYFSSLKNLLASYGIVIERLMRHNFDFQAYREDIENDHYLSVFVKEMDFKVSRKHYKDCPLAEQVFNETEEILWEAYYVTNPIIITEVNEDANSMEALVHIQLGDKYNIYLNGSYMYVSLNNKKYFVYLD